MIAEKWLGRRGYLPPIAEYKEGVFLILNEVFAGMFSVFYSFFFNVDTNSNAFLY